MNSPKIMRSDDLRVQNRHRILSTLRDEGPLSRAEIGRLTGLSQAALSTLFGMMTEQGIVTSESSTVTHKRGRPRTTVALAGNAGVVVTVALTIDHLSFNLVTYAGETVQQQNHRLDTRSLTESELASFIASGIESILKPYEIKQLKAICIGFQGVTDASLGVLRWSPILSIDNVPIGSLLKDAFQVPVIVNNDCGLIAKALHNQEAQKLGASFAAVLFSHGIGLGVYLGGQPFTGAHSSALELGHVCFEKDGALCRCGKQGCIEAYAADYGIVRTAKKLAPDEMPSGVINEQSLTELMGAAKTRGPEQEAFELAGKAIGFGLATVFTLLDPLPVALVGHNTEAVNLMRNEIQNALTTVSRSPEDYSKLVHCYNEDRQLLLNGLVLEAMALVDKTFAENADDSLIDVI